MERVWSEDSGSDSEVATVTATRPRWRGTVVAAASFPVSAGIEGSVKGSVQHFITTGQVGATGEGISRAKDHCQHLSYFENF